MIGASNIYFKEEQKLRELWLWLILAFATMASIGGMLLAFMNNAASDTALYIGLVAVILVQALVIIPLYISNFEIRVNQEGVHYKWYPFHRSFRTIRRSELANYYVRNVPGLKRGISFVWGYGWAYNAAGGQGIQFELRNKKRIFLGSKKITAFRNAIEQLMQLKN